MYQVELDSGQHLVGYISKETTGNSAEEDFVLRNASSETRIVASRVVGFPPQLLRRHSHTIGIGTTLKRYPKTRWGISCVSTIGNIQLAQVEDSRESSGMFFASNAAFPGRKTKSFGERRELIRMAPRPLLYLEDLKSSTVANVSSNHGRNVFIELTNQRQGTTKLTHLRLIYREVSPCRPVVDLEHHGRSDWTQHVN